MDGIDGVVLQTDGHHTNQHLAHTSLPYNQLTQILFKSLEFAGYRCQGDLIEIESQFLVLLQKYLETQLGFSAEEQEQYFSQLINNGFDLNLQGAISHSTQLHIQVIETLLNSLAQPIELIGYHGQTIFHSDILKKSLQLGRPKLMADRFQCPVVFNFREHDLQQGGRGAPLAPIYHWSLAMQKQQLPLVVINCGGIANISYIPSKYPEEILGFDCGPGNVLLDRWIKLKTKGLHSMDHNGQFGLRGQLNTTLLKDLFNYSCVIEQENFYLKPAPKSLNSFDIALIPQLNEVTLEEGCHTLAAFTAQQIVFSLRSIFYENPPQLFILAGGGWKNPLIYNYFKDYLVKELPSANILSISDWCAHEDYLEAELMAFLAMRSYLGLPITYPKMTGVDKPCLGGQMVLPS